MKHQSTLFENQIRVKPIKYKEYKRLKIYNERELSTKNGIIITVVKKKQHITGVGDRVYYQISDRGMVIQPLTSKGVINYLKNN